MPWEKSVSMSMNTCDKCGARYWQDHECPEDGEALLDRIRDLEKEVEELKARLEELEK